LVSKLAFSASKSASRLQELAFLASKFGYPIDIVQMFGFVR